MNCGVDIIRALLREFESFIVLGHTDPDADAIGSCLGLAMALEKYGKQVSVWLEQYSHKYHIIPGRHLLHNGEPDSIQINGAAVICLDCGDLSRLGKARILTEGAAEFICIDHHYTNTGYARYNLVDGTASSTSEMIYHLLTGLVDLDNNIAAALYAGVVGDTGGFRFSSTKPETLRMAADLISFGIPFTEIYTELEHRRSYTRTKLLGRVIGEARRLCGGRVVYACVTRAMLKGLNDAPDATGMVYLDGAAEFLLNVQGAEISFLIYERDDGEIKVSFRSRSLNVGAIAALLGGGGHQLAAGASIRSDIETVRTRVLPLVEQVLNEKA